MNIFLLMHTCKRYFCETMHISKKNGKSNMIIKNIDAVKKINYSFFYKIHSLWQKSCSIVLLKVLQPKYSWDYNNLIAY